MLKRINEALPGLVVSILLYGVMVELIGVWFVKDRIAYSIGVWFGIAIECGHYENLSLAAAKAEAATYLAVLEEQTNMDFTYPE